jgi:hypothetical protein
MRKWQPNTIAPIGATGAKMHKFKVMITAGQMHMDDEVRARMTKATRGAKDGPYELLLREEVKWDTTQMRKYYHGPCLKFLVEQFKHLGHVISKDEAKQWVKTRFGPTKDIELGVGSTVTVPKSTAEWDFKTYKGVLRGLDEWCMNYLSCNLPTAEEIE